MKLLSTILLLLSISACAHDCKRDFEWSPEDQAIKDAQRDRSVRRSIAAERNFEDRMRDYQRFRK